MLFLLCDEAESLKTLAEASEAVIGRLRRALLASCDRVRHRRVLVRFGGEALIGTAAKDLAGSILGEARVLKLKPGKHTFRVTNADVPYVLGFWLRGEGLVGRATLPSVSGGGLGHRKRLKRARTEAGLTQVDAAERLKKPQSFVSKSESGERRVDVIELEAFARAYGKSLMFFYEK